MPIPDAVTEAGVSSLVAHMLDAEGCPPTFALGVRFVNDRVMQAAHVQYMGIDEPTDIMTFPYADPDDPLGEVTEAGGDLIISVETAAANAAEAGWTTARELEFLIAHGVLHILGWDDPTPEQRAAMLDRQRALISSWPRENS